MNKLFDEKTIEKLNGFEVDLPPNDWSVLLAKMPKKRKPVPIWYYAIAASLAILLGIGSVMYLYRDTDKHAPLMATTAPTGQTATEDCLCVEKNTHTPKTTSHKESRIDNSSAADCLKSIDYKEFKNKKTPKYNKKKNIAASPAITEQDQSTPQNRDNENPVPKDDVNKQSAAEPKQKLPVTDDNKSLDDYIKGIEKPTQKEDAKKQRKDLKERNSLMKNYYASANTSISTLSGNRNNSRPNNTRIWSADGLVSIMSALYTETQHRLPVSFGLSFGFPIAGDNIYINMGIKYTYLYSKSSNMETGSNKLYSTEEQQLHYLGIPVSVAYKFLDNSLFKLYMAGGATVEKGILNNNTKKYYTQNGVIDSRHNERSNIKGLLYSLNLKAGAGIALSKHLDFFLEPEVSWYIPNTKYPQPRSKITESPIALNISGGLRWNF